MKPKIPSLGMGLSTLIGKDYHQDAEINDRDEKIRLLDTSLVIANINQPRKDFDAKTLQELADSILAKGVIVPIIVRKAVEGKYLIVAGERRFRACKLAGITQIPVIIKDLSDSQTTEYAIIENVQRQDLNAIEEAVAYKNLAEDYDYTQAEIAQVVGKSRSYVANLLRLLNLPQEVQNLIVKHHVSMGHARALLATDDPLKIAKSIVDDGLNVRQVEQMSKHKIARNVAKNKTTPNGNVDLASIEELLTNQLGLRITISSTSEESGVVMLHYTSLKELDRILQLLPTK